MSIQIIGVAVIALAYFLIRYLNRTDTPKIKNIPEIPGYPLFGSLLEFGASHAKVARRLAEKYGPVFQVRLGNRVCSFSTKLFLSLIIHSALSL
jgi:phenylacetate 2-hydroxylase